MKYVIVSIIFTLFSCNGQKKTVSESKDSDKPEADSSLVLLLQDEYSEFVTEETIVIRDQKRLKSFYSKINKTRKPGFPVPQIDFTKEMVVIQCSGQLNGGGNSKLMINNETNTEIVMTSLIEQESKDVSAAVLTNPYCVYKMPLTDKLILVKDGIK